MLSCKLFFLFFLWSQDQAWSHSCSKAWQLCPKLWMDFYPPTRHHTWVWTSYDQFFQKKKMTVHKPVHTHDLLQVINHSIPPAIRSLLFKRFFFCTISNSSSLGVCLVSRMSSGWSTVEVPWLPWMTLGWSEYEKFPRLAILHDLWSE